MTSQLYGRINWEASRDRQEGHRDYKISWLVYTNDPLDGPLIIGNTPGLAWIGTSWIYGNDNDQWALCTPETTIKPVLTGEPNNWWIVEQNFSTRPIKRCQDSQIENPLAEPYRISGSFNPYTRQRFFDRNNVPITTSAYEPIKGDLTEFDDSKPTVKIGYNIAELPLSLFAPMMHMVNDSTLWGLNRRCVKLSNATWQRHMYGTCSFFYSVDFDFDIDYNTFDRPYHDWGRRYLRPGGTPGNQDDYTWIVTKEGDKDGRFLDGNGGLLDEVTPQTVVTRKIEAYAETNLLMLGIPSTL